MPPLRTPRREPGVGIACADRRRQMRIQPKLAEDMRLYYVYVNSPGNSYSWPAHQSTSRRAGANLLT